MCPSLEGDYVSTSVEWNAGRDPYDAYPEPSIVMGAALELMGTDELYPPLLQLCISWVCLARKVVPLLWAKISDAKHGNKWMPRAVDDKMCHGVIRADEHRPNADPQYLHEEAVKETTVTGQPGHVVTQEVAEAPTDSLSAPLPRPPAHPSAKDKLSPRADLDSSSASHVTGQPGQASSETLKPKAGAPRLKRPAAANAPVAPKTCLPGTGGSAQLMAPLKRAGDEHSARLAT